MDFTGIVRQVDNLGRIVIPREFRKLLDMTDGVDSFEISVNENKEIVLKKHNPSCALCCSKEQLIPLGNKLVCCKCINELNTKKEENGL